MDNNISPDGVLFAIAEAYEGRIPGRTLLQKVAYFIGEDLRADLGYGPHYYGPYSRDITATLEANQDVGALIENRRETSHVFAGHDAPRTFYEYTLTERGRKFQELHKVWHENQYLKAVDIAKAIKGLEVTYMQLAFASKVHYVLFHAANGVLTVSEVKSMAADLGWSMGDADVHKGADILRQLGYIERSD